MPEPEPESNIAETIEQVIGMVIRGRWLILGAACLISIAVIAYALKLPDQYQSQATLLVVQQQVSQRYVEADNSTPIRSAIQAMKLEVLSGSQLIRIINDLGLYHDSKEREPDLLVERMRQKDIDIEPIETNAPGLNELYALTISFTADTPQLAQQVSSRLTSLFIQQNSKTQEEKAANTSKFLTEQLDASRQRLAGQDQRLQEFKTSNLGELPEQQQANLLALTDTRAKLGTISASLAQAQKQQLSIESSLNQRLSRLQSDRAELLSRFTEKYPPVIQKDREIATVRAILSHVQAGTSAAAKTGETNTSDDPELAGIIRQAEANTTDIEGLSKQQEKLTKDSELYEARLNLTPVREQQLSEILREEDVFKQEVANLEKQKLQSEMATSLEENQQGQQFRLVDPPGLPSKPSGPKRLKLSLGGLGGGVAVGLVLAFLMDMRKSTFYSEKALSRRLSLPLVMGIPLVRTPRERRARAVRIGFEWLLGCTMTLAMCAAEFYVFRHG